MLALVTIGKRIGIALLSFLFPGLGHGLAHRRSAMVLWMALTPVPPLAALVFAPLVWLFPLVMLGSAVTAFIVVGKPRAAPAESVATAVVAGREAEPLRAKWNKPQAVVAVVFGVVCGGLMQMTISAMKLPSTSMEPTLHIGSKVIVDHLSYRFREPRSGELIVFDMPCQPDRQYLKRVIAKEGQTVEVRCDVLHIDGIAVPTTHVTGPCSYRDNASDEWRTSECSRYRQTIGGETFDTYHSALRPADPPKTNFVMDFPRPDEPPASCATEPGGAPAANQATGSIATTDRHAGDCDPHVHYVVPADHVFVMGDHRANSNDSRFWGAVPIENIKGRVVGPWWF